VVYLDDDGRLVLSPSDLADYLACEHLSELSFAVAVGQMERPAVDDPGMAVLRRRGLEHEAAYLGRLEDQGLAVARVPVGRLEAEVAETERLLAAGVPVVYQAALVQGGGPGQPAWRGHADFLRRVSEPSALGPFAYEPEDTKLARRVTPAAVLQLGEYAEQLSRIQGRPPAHLHVVLGDGRRVSLRTDDSSAYLRLAKRRFEEALAAGADAYPWPVAHCGVCAWRAACDRRRLADGHLTTVAGLGPDQCRTLERHGVGSIGQLASMAPGPVPGLSPRSLEGLRHQARLQVAALENPGAPPPYELLACPEPGFGLAGLPEPSPGDLFFDIESDPFAEEGGLEYLFGVGWVAGDGTFAYRAFWAHDPAGEARAFTELVDFIGARRQVHPDLHVYHYAPYEPAALARLMGRHGTREHEIDDLFRAKVLVDLLRVVRQGVRIGTPSYSLKKLEALYMAARTEAITDGGSSIAEYERWLETGDPAILHDLAAYNEVDCDSTRRLRDWLEARRAEYEVVFGRPLARPDRPTAEASTGVVTEASENDDLRRALAGRGAREDGDRPARAMWLLGQLLEWHRREEKPEWWRYFDRIERCQEDDLWADTEAVAGLVYDGEAGQVRRSTIHRYRFDPAQEHKLAAGQTWVDPASERQKAAGGERPSGPGEIHRVDAGLGLLELRRGTGSSAPHPRCLIPPGPVPTADQRAALRKVARSVIDHGLDGPGPFQAVRDLLAARPPRLAGPAPGPLVQPGEDPADAAVRLVGSLEGGCLAVQGPPGSGKTRLAARAVVALVAAGKRVGITANSHAVIANLLLEVVTQAEALGVPLTASQKSGDGRAVDHPSVTQRDNDGMAADLATADVLAGTAWLFTRPAFVGALDHLVVDEAGQLSLANALAVGTAARNLVLVGDPMQLAQPSKGTHPPGAAASGLAHLLGGHQTIAADLGVFLATTHRLHPAICRYVSEAFYEGRLRAEPGCERQALGGPGPLAGSGLRWIPVDHRGNRTSSVEEAEVVRGCCAELVGRPWSARTGAVRPLTEADIVVVTPYNAQVSLLAEALGPGIEVGTVDKFQGRQAPVVLVSLAASSAEDVPRGIEFLYSAHRLNVAVSRAQGLVVMVASPALLAAPCRSVDQLRLVNGLCRYAEMASGRPDPT